MGAGKIWRRAGGAGLRRAGVGKSRLVEAFRESLEGEPHTRLRYFCSQHHQESALFPFIGQLERKSGFERDDTPPARLDKLEALVIANALAPDDLSSLANRCRKTILC